MTVIDLSLSPQDAAVEIVRTLREPDTRPTWWADACATCCWAASRRTTTSPPTPPRRGDAHFSPHLGGGRAIRRRAGAVSAQAAVARRGQHGMPTQVSAPSRWIEVATFRNDGLYSDGRHPDQVSFSRDPREDVQRRDFTINGLLLDPLVSRGRATGGSHSLSGWRRRSGRRHHSHHRRSRAPLPRGQAAPAARGALRRALRLRDRAADLAAIRELARQIAQVSRERIRDELTKMLTEGQARRAFELLDASGLLRARCCPSCERMKGVEQPPQFHPEGDVWVHTLAARCEMLPGRLLAHPGLGRRCCTMWASRRPSAWRPTASASTATSRSATPWREISASACASARRHRADRRPGCQPHALCRRAAMKESTFKRFLRLPRFAEHLELHRLDCLASHGDLTIYDLTREHVRTHVRRSRFGPPR